MLLRDFFKKKKVTNQDPVWIAGNTREYWSETTQVFGMHHNTDIRISSFGKVITVTDSGKLPESWKTDTLLENIDREETDHPGTIEKTIMYLNQGVLPVEHIVEMFDPERYSY